MHWWKQKEMISRFRNHFNRESKLKKTLPSPLNEESETKSFLLNALLI